MPFNQSYTTPNYLSSLQNTKSELEGKLNETKKEKAVPILNFKPQSVPWASNFKDVVADVPTPKTTPAPVAPQQPQVEEEDLLQKYLQDTEQDEDSKRELMKALEDGVDPNELISHLQTQWYEWPKQSVLWGLAERTKDRFQTAAKVGRQDIETQWKLQWAISTWVAGWLAWMGTLYDAWFTWAIELLKVVAPEKVEEAVAGGAEKLAETLAPLWEKINEFAESSPEARQLVDKAKLVWEWWAWAVWAWAVWKTLARPIKSKIDTALWVVKSKTSDIKRWITETLSDTKPIELPWDIEAGIKWIDDIPRDIEKVMLDYKASQGIDDVTFREKLAWITEKDKVALDEYMDAPKFEQYMKDANFWIRRDKADTPYWKGAELSIKAEKLLLDDIREASKARTKILKDADIKVNPVPATDKIKDMLREAFNVEDISKVDDWYSVKPVEWREALIEKKADFKAIEELEKLYKADTAIKSADRIKKLQNFIYWNYSSTDLSGISKEMKQFLERAVWVYNSELKVQLPPKYAEIMKWLSDDIVTKNELERIFQPSEWVTNRWEMAMKRLSSWTTTGSEVKRIAKIIKDRTGVDLINEARVRQLTMDIVWDERWKTFFWAIGESADKGVPWLIKDTLKWAGRLALWANKEKLATSIARRRKPEVITPKKRDFNIPKKKQTTKKSTKKLAPEKKTLALPQKSVTPKPATVTPQTIERWVVLDSKKEILNTKWNLNFRKLQNKLNDSDLDLESIQKTMDFWKIEELDQGSLLKFLNAQDRQKSILRQEYEQWFSREMSWDEFRKSKLDELFVDEEKIYQTLSQIENAKAGERIFIEWDVWWDYDVLWQASSFPKWVSSDLRDSKLFNKTLAYINNSDIIPEKNSRMRALADEIYSEINPKLQWIYEDTKWIQEFSKQSGKSNTWANKKLSPEKRGKSDATKNEVSTKWVKKESPQIDIQKPLQNLTTKNVFNTSNTIAKQLWVPVKKVQEVIKEFIDKYWDDIKNKLWELADEILDSVK